MVSVIVPNYNHSIFLRKRIDSILLQSYQDFEIIILDDSSTDNSREIIEQYRNHPKVSHIVYNTLNSGSTFKQWNKEIELASGEYIWIAESDDYCELNFLEELTKLLTADQEITLVFCQSNRVNEANIVTGNWLDRTEYFERKMFLKNFVLDGSEFVEKYLIQKNIIPNASAVLFRKCMANQVGRVDTDINLRYCGDWLFYVKLITNHKIAFCSKSLNYFRYHSASVIAKANKKHDDIYLINLDSKMRIKMMNFLEDEKPFKLEKIKKVYIYSTRKDKLLRALYYIKNDQKLNGFLILFSVFDLFIIESVLYLLKQTNVKSY